MSSLIYIAVVIIIGIISSMNKAAKNKGKTTPRGGMPTFGGGDGGPLRRTARQEQPADGERGPREGSGFPAPADESSRNYRYDVPAEEREYRPSPPWKESPDRPSPDYETGEGLSLEQSDDRDGGMQARTEAIQRELEQIQAAFDGMAGAGGPDHDKTRDKSGRAGSARKPAASPAARTGLADNNRQALQNGLIWAEILGPPRARQPRSTRR